MASTPSVRAQRLRLLPTRAWSTLSSAGFAHSDRQSSVELESPMDSAVPAKRDPDFRVERLTGQARNVRCLDIPGGIFATAKPAP